MKTLAVAHLLLLDCGKASKQTRGTISGPFFEGGTPPNIWFP